MTSLRHILRAVARVNPLTWPILVTILILALFQFERAIPYLAGTLLATWIILAALLWRDYIK